MPPHLEFCGGNYLVLPPMLVLCVCGCTLIIIERYMWWRTCASSSMCMYKYMFACVCTYVLCVHACILYNIMCSIFNFNWSHVHANFYDTFFIIIIFFGLPL